MAEFQIFGTAKCSDTRKAQRFFQERRVRFHFRDLNEKGISKGEFEAISAKIPVEDLLDREGKRFRDRQLAFKIFNAEEELLADALLFKTPIVRFGRLVTVGYQPDEWKKWIAG
jgi:arsenate reductase-like glutaredoxin family protein